MAENRYDPHQIEPKWRAWWEERELFHADLAGAERPCYTLVMLPYPSGDKLHVGHWYHYGPSDSWARFMRMRGYDTFEPLGFDSFGLPAENFAVKTGVHPKDSTDSNIANMIAQLKRMGAMWDWERTLKTSDPSYYRWTQWIFLKLYEKGLAYQAEIPVWWCPELGTTLANEEVIDGKSEVGGYPCVRRPLRQWVLKITDYAEQLLDGLDDVEWPDSTKEMQRNWIGRSEGLEIEFRVDGEDAPLPVYTTRPDTLMGVTFISIAGEHPLAFKAAQSNPELAAFLAELRRGGVSEAELEAQDKRGMATGQWAIHPLTGEDRRISNSLMRLVELSLRHDVPETDWAVSHIRAVSR